MVPLGLWVAIAGYGILYAGVVKLGGGTCTLAQAFTGTCKPASGSNQSSTTPNAQSGFAPGASTTGLPAYSSPGGGSW